MAYELNVPPASDKDTIDVKIDVTHHLFQVTHGVSFPAWEFGGSVPGPTLKVRVRQTVRFSMTNRSNESMNNMAMTMRGQSMHAIGHHILDKVWIDSNPHNEMQGLQSVYLGPASGAIVDFVLPEKGIYTFVDHSFADAEMGLSVLLRWSKSTYSTISLLDHLLRSDKFIPFLAPF